MRTSLRMLLATIALLVAPTACHDSPTEPSCAGIGGAFSGMTLTSCGSADRFLGSVVMVQTGCSFEAAIPSVGRMRGTLNGDVGTFSVTFGPACQGTASGTFTVTYVGKVVRLNGTWSGVITNAGEGCPCTVGPTDASFRLYV